MRSIRTFTAALVALACVLSWGGANAQGVTKTTILIGQSSPFSGSNKELGDDIREGLQAYFKQVNEAGGVHGRTIELIALDDGNDAKRAGDNGRILIDQRGVLALIGYASATLSLPALPYV
jgi:ABC-type branched-subunit amino acid transport system substrate-binding protein